MTPEQLWDRLCLVRSLSFTAQSGANTGWSGGGAGTVQVQVAGHAVMTFHEQGNWRPAASEREIRFTNIFRWTRTGEVLRLEHLRFGEANPVFLFDLAQVSEMEWRSASPHVCSEDCYSAVLLVGVDGIVLKWTIDGPRKKEAIEYHYW